MAIMKTLTVGSETYTVRDPEAVSFEQPQALTPMQQQTARGNIGAMSAKEAADQLCPAFAESGAVVTCEPVAGYALTVTAQPDAANITRCGKNLIDPEVFFASSIRTTLDGDVFTTSFTSGGIHVGYSQRVFFPKGTYTFTFIPVTEGASATLFVYARSNGASIVANRVLNASNPSCTFTADEGFAPCLAGNLSGSGLGTYSYKLQLEAGSVATAYEPYRGEAFAPGDPVTALSGVNTIYADAGLVTVTGRADPVAIIHKLTNAIISLGGNI